MCRSTHLSYIISLNIHLYAYIYIYRLTSFVPFSVRSSFPTCIYTHSSKPFTRESLLSISVCVCSSGAEQVVCPSPIHCLIFSVDSPAVDSFLFSNPLHLLKVIKIAVMLSQPTPPIKYNPSVNKIFFPNAGIALN